MTRFSHIPVLLQETIRELKVRDGDIILDATLGGGGHALALCESGRDLTLVGIDADQDALRRTEERLAGIIAKKIFAKSNFRNIDQVLAQYNISHIDKALFDLGLGSHSYESGRGFSFQKDEPLVMTLDESPSGVTASTVVNEWSEETLADIIYGFGEEKFSRRIAKAIVEARESAPIQTTFELAEIVKKSVPVWYRFGRIHPATKTFQAIRIAVNDELNSLQEGLKKAWSHLNPGGRMAVISFHSLEDRIVKNLFKGWKDEGTASLVSKKPIVPGPEEIANNPRARSSKLRIIEKKK